MKIITDFETTMGHSLVLEFEAQDPLCQTFVDYVASLPPPNKLRELKVYITQYPTRPVYRNGMTKLQRIPIRKFCVDFAQHERVILKLALGI